MNHEQATAKLKRLLACQEARDWFTTQPDPETAWAKCERGDWMLWLCGKFSGRPESDGRKTLVLAACQCARLALKHVKKGEKRPLVCIETAERWAKGEATIEELQEARRAVADAAAAAAADARSKALKKCADIVRKFYPSCPGMKGT